MKKLAFGYIIAFVFTFMLFVYEPIMMYSTNVNDFWFDFSIMIAPVLKLFMICFVSAVALITLFYFLTKLIFKNDKIYSIILIIFFGLLFVTYIQGNYLINNLPSLDGNMIEWNGFIVDDVISGIIWMITIGLLIFFCIKFKLDKTVKYLTFVSVAIFLMLSTSFVSVMLNKDVYVKKEGIITTNNINDISKNKNFLIFLVDAVDSETFEEILNQNHEYKNVFEDFTYFKDTLSMYPFTRDSIPYILGGKLNTNERQFRDYYIDSLSNSIFLNKLNEKKYNANIYDYELIWNEEIGRKIQNVGSFNKSNLDLVMFFKQEMKYVLFKYLPYSLKKYSKIEWMDFNLCVEKYDWSNDENYNNLLNNKTLNKTKDNYFQFLHVEGAHTPFDYDENLNPIENGTYIQKVKGTIKMIDTYIQRLKENGVYDNSVIVIMADHGYDKKYDTILGRMNPILLIKGTNEKHGMAVSDKVVSHSDLQSTFLELLEDKKSTELFKNMDEKRERNFIFYEYKKEDHMIEYKTLGKASDIKSFKKTGNVYDLEVK